MAIAPATASRSPVEAVPPSRSEPTMTAPVIAAASAASIARAGMPLPSVASIRATQTGAVLTNSTLRAIVV